MSSLIEQAAARLQQLRQAGVTIPTLDQVPGRMLPGLGEVDGGFSLEATSQTKQVPVRTSRHVELDIEALHAAGVVTPNAPRSQIADQYRVIKRPLVKNAIGRGASHLNHANLIMVTSALPGEGKTFTSVNLAMSLAAELDHTVMLVDADLARPSVPRVLGLPTEPDLLGLLDLLDGRADMAAVLLKTNIDKLTIMPSGKPHPRATEMLASVAMRQLLDDIASRYPDRIVIFDSPPLLVTTESRVLATNMGQVVVVVHAGKTLRGDVQTALSTIEACPVKLLLLNQARADAQGIYRYGYGYEYGYSLEKA